MSAVVAAAVLAVGGVAISLLLPSNEGNIAATVVVHTADDPGEAPRIAAVTQMVDELPSRLASGDRSDLAASMMDRFSDVREALPAGSRLVVDERSWHRTGAIASLPVTVEGLGRSPTRFLIVVTSESGSWKLMATVALGARS